MKPQNNTALIEIKLKETTMIALDILDYFRSEQIAYECTPFLLEMYNEAIAELEEHLSDKDGQIKWLREELKYHKAELEALQQPKRCDGCWYVKITINSVICGKNGTFKEADDYCKYYNPKEQ